MKPDPKVEAVAAKVVAVDIKEVAADPKVEAVVTKVELTKFE